MSTNRGFTLVEVITSLAILGFIVLAFINLFGSSFANIFSMGEMDIAMSRAAGVLDVLYLEEVGYSDENEIIDLLEQQNVEHVSDKTELYTDPPDKGKRFYIQSNYNPFNAENIVEGYEVTIVVFQRGERNHATLTAFIRGSE